MIGLRLDLGVRNNGKIFHGGFYGWRVINDVTEGFEHNLVKIGVAMLHIG